MKDPIPSIAQRFSDSALIDLSKDFSEHIADEKELHNRQTSLQEDQAECLDSLTRRVESLEVQSKFSTLQLQALMTKMDALGIQMQTVLNIVEQSKGAWKVLGIMGILVTAVGGFVAWAVNHLNVVMH